MAESNAAKDSPTCKVDGCGVLLSDMKVLCIRTKVCEAHMKASTLELEGARSRFCQQCSRVEPLTNFDGLRRSCRDGLARIGERRREKVSAQQQASARVLAQQKWGNGGTPFASPALQQGVVEALPAPITSTATKAQLLMAREHCAHTSAPLPLRIGLKRASTGFSSGELEAARKLSRRISVTIRASGAGESTNSSFADSPNGDDTELYASVPRLRSDSRQAKDAHNEASECALSAAMSAAAADFRQQQQTETSAKGSVVLPNPFGGDARPISLSIRSHSSGPEPTARAMVGAEGASSRATAHLPWAGTPCSLHSTNTTTPFASDQPSSPAKRSSSALGPPAGMPAPSRVSVERMLSIQDTPAPSPTPAEPLSEGRAEVVSAEGALMGSGESREKGASLQELLQRAAASSREDATNRRLRFAHSLHTMQ